MSFASFARTAGRRVVAVAATVTLLGSGLAAAPASAQPAPVAGSSEFAWGFHQSVYGSSEGLPLPVGDAVRGFADQVSNWLAPGVVAQKLHERELANQPAPPPPAPEPAPANPQFPNFDPSRCPKTARACIDLDNELTWLQKDGVVTYGPVKESAGAPYPATATPRGLHYVNRKVKNEVSRVYNNAPMPYSVYFTNNGIAFHEGDVNLWSHGCIHLNHQDAVHYFNTLQIGDQVAVF